MLRTSAPASGVAVLAIALAGCVGKVAPAEADSSAPGTAVTSNSSASAAPSATGEPDPSAPDAASPGAPPASSTTAIGAEAFTAPQVQSAQALCNSPHGPALAPATVSALRSDLLGSWYLCSIENGYPGAIAQVSITFSADGSWVALLPDGQGGLVKGVGVDSVGTYDLGWTDAGPDDPAASGEPAYVRYLAGGFNAYFVAFEDDPSRMKVVIGTAGTTMWYVRLSAS